MASDIFWMGAMVERERGSRDGERGERGEGRGKREEGRGMEGIQGITGEEGGERFVCTRIL